MLDINDNDFRLLKMTGSLLSNAKDQKTIDEALSNYRNFATKIDKRLFDDFLNKIGEYSSSMTLEEELVFLEELESSYNQLYQLQCKLKSIYSTYTDLELTLSDLECIDIEKIIERKNAISGYLINSKNSDECRKQLEEYNLKLTNEERRKINNQDTFLRFEQELRNLFINSEGRISSGETTVYTSIKSEYDDNGFNLKRLLSDSEFREKTYREIVELNNEQDDLIKSLEISYNVLPNAENREIMNGAEMEQVKIKYHLALIKIVMLISNDEKEYDRLVEKREKLSDLISARKGYLNKLGKKVVVDPFDRIKVFEQLQYLKNEFMDNTRIINRIRASINEIGNKLNDLVSNNSDLLIQLNSMDRIFIKDRTAFSDISVATAPSEKSATRKVSDNMVIGVRAADSKFELGKVREKAISVIKRINSSMLKSGQKEENVAVPTLVVEKVDETMPEIEMPNFIEEDNQIDKQTTSDDSIFEDNEDNPFDSVSLFNDRSSDDDIWSKSSEKAQDEPFWQSKEDSIDEQIKRLKLVA